MPRRLAAYLSAYREQIIALTRAGRKSRELAQEFEPSKQTIRNWSSKPRRIVESVPACSRSMN